MLFFLFKEGLEYHTDDSPEWQGWRTALSSAQKFLRGLVLVFVFSGLHLLGLLFNQWILGLIFLLWFHHLNYSQMFCTFQQHRS